MNKQIQIDLNTNDMNILYSVLNHSNDKAFQNFPDINLITNEGLYEEQWKQIKSYLETDVKFMGIKEGDNFPSDWDKESFLEKINDNIK